MNIYLVILAVTIAAVIPLLCLLAWLHTKDRRMVKAQEAYQARRKAQAEAGHMDALDRAQWLIELHTYARKHPSWRRELDK